MEMSVNENFRSEVLQAVERHRNPSMTPALTPNTYSAVTYNGYEISRRFLFYKVGLFEECFKLKPAELGLPVETLEDHTGPVQGVLLAAEDPHAPLEVRALYRNGGTLREDLQTPAQILRPSQAREFQKVWESDLAKVQPKGLTKPASVLEASALPGRIEAYLKEKQQREQEAAERAAAMANLLPPHVPADEPQEEEEPEEDEEDQLEETAVPQLVLPSAQQRPKKGKGRGRAKAKGKGRSPGKSKARAHAKVATPVPHERPLAAAPVRPPAGRVPVKEEAASEAGSASSTKPGSTSASQSSKARRQLKLEKDTSPELQKQEKVMSYLDIIDVGKILEGSSKSCGRELWQAQASLDALEEKTPGTAAAVYLKSHIKLAQTAQVCWGRGTAAEKLNMVVTFV